MCCSNNVRVVELLDQVEKLNSGLMYWQRKEHLVYKSITENYKSSAYDLEM